MIFFADNYRRVCGGTIYSMGIIISSSHSQSVFRLAVYRTFQNGVFLPPYSILYQPITRNRHRLFPFSVKACPCVLSVRAHPMAYTETLLVTAVRVLLKYFGICLHGYHRMRCLLRLSGCNGCRHFSIVMYIDSFVSSSMLFGMVDALQPAISFWCRQSTQGCSGWKEILMTAGAVISSRQQC